MERAPASTGPMRFALSKLRKKNISENFIGLLQDNYREDERMKVLDLNILGFLRSRPAQDARIPAWELKKVEKFLHKNRKAFREAERKFHVPKEVVASLLWVETKYGRDIGTFHVGSVYLSLLQADYPTILDQTLDLAKERAGDLTREIQDKVAERSKLKAEWALGEVQALQKIYDKGYRKAISLEGSFSGAFGLAQFVPSSYLSWAKGRKRHPDLFQPHDSIYSVANYLSVNGWDRRSKEAQQGALFHYNRDQDYVDRILRMSRCLRSPKLRRRWNSKRNVASARSC